MSWFNRGLCLLHLGRLKEAESSVERCLVLDTDHAKAKSLQAHIQHKLRNRSAAVQAPQQPLHQAPPQAPPQVPPQVPPQAPPQPASQPAAAVRTIRIEAAHSTIAVVGRDQATLAAAEADRTERGGNEEPEEKNLADGLRVWRLGSLVAGRYEVREVARGGMGVVYLAFDHELQRMVAVKTPLPSTLAAEDGRGRFYREAEAWIAIGIHPNICTAYYVQEIGGLPRLFIEYVDGGDLDLWLRERHDLGLEQRLDIAIQVARGLHHTHTLAWVDDSGQEHRGLVHRDLKPANVLMTIDGTARVTDFGLVRAGSGPGALPTGREAGNAGVRATIEQTLARSSALTSSWQTLTLAGGVIGTPPYVAPEIWQGSHSTGILSDIYAYGCMLYDILCAHRPYSQFDEGGTAQRETQLLAWLKTHVSEQPLDPLQLNPELDPVLAKVMLACLAKEPQERPGSFAELRDALTLAYQRCSGSRYQRPEPQPAQLLADSLNNRAVSYMTLGHVARAEEAWHRARTIDPRHREATCNQVIHEWQSAALSDAEVLRRIDEVERGRQLSWRDQHLRGKLHLLLDDLPAAVGTLREAVAAEQVSLEVRRDLGVAIVGLARRTGDRELLGEAEQVLRAVLETMPYDPEALVGLTATLRTLGRIEEAEQLWQEARAQLGELPDQAEQAFSQYLPGFALRRSLRQPGMVEMLIAAANNRIICRAGGTQITLWSADDGRWIGGFPVPGDVKRGRSLAVSGDGSRLVGTGEALSLAVWELPSGKQLGRCESQPSFVTAVAVRRDGRLALTGGADRILRVWDLENGLCLQSLTGHGAFVTAAAFLPQGLAVSAGGDGQLRVWDLGDGSCRHSLAGHTGPVNDLTTTADGGAVISAGQDGSLRLWDPESGRLRSRLRGHDGAVTAVAVPGAEELVLSGGEDGTVRTWSIDQGVQLQVMRFRNPISGLAVPAQGNTAFVGHGVDVLMVDLGIRQHRRAPFALTLPVSSGEMEQRQHRFEERLRVCRELIGSNDLEAAAAALQEAREVAGFARHPQALALSRQILDRCPRATLSAVAEQCAFEVADGEGGALAAQYLPDGSRAALAGQAGAVLLDLASGSRAASYRGHTAALTSLAVSRDGRRLVAAGRDGQLHLWDLASGRHEGVVKAHDGSANAVAITARCDVAVSAGSDGAVVAWHLGSSALTVLGRHQEAATAIATSADGRVAVSGSWDLTAVVWELRRGIRLVVLEGHEAALAALAVSPDCRRIASAAADGTVRLWDLASGRCLRVLRTGHAASATCVAFSPDARFLLSGDRQGHLQLWDLRSTSPLRTIEAHTAGVSAVGFSPDGYQALSAGADGTLRLWSLDWEPELHDRLAGGDKARPFLEVYLSLRDDAAGLAGELHDGDFEQIRHDLVRRGLGGITRQEVQLQLTSLLETWQERRQAEEQQLEQQQQQQRRRQRVAPVSRLLSVLTHNLGVKVLAAAAVIVLLLLIPLAVRTPVSGELRYNSTLLPALREAHETESASRKVPGLVYAVYGEPSVVVGAGSIQCAGDDRYRYLEVIRRPKQGSSEPGAAINDLEQIRRYETAMVCLPRFADSRIIAGLLETLSQELPHARLQDLLTLLVQIGDPAIPQLEKALASPAPQVRHWAARALAEMRSITSLAVLADALESDSPRISEAASTVLQEILSGDIMRTDDAFRIISSLAVSIDPEARRNAVYGLAVFQDTGAVAALLDDALEDPNEQVREAAKSIREQLLEVRLKGVLRERR